jgi:sugar lactone lactonase YvrE
VIEPHLPPSQTPEGDLLLPAAYAPPSPLSRRTAVSALAVLAAVLVGAYLLVGRLNAKPIAAPTARPATTVGPAANNELERFHGPTGIGVDAAGHIYVADQANSWIKEFSPQGKVLKQIGTAPGSGSDELQGPTDVAIAPDGTILVADFGNARIQEFSPSGVPINTINHWSPNGSGSGGRFDQFGSVAVDRQGHVYATDVFHERVMTFSRHGTVLLRFGQRGNALGRFNTPTGIAVDGAGNIYVSDRDHNRIEKFSPTGIPLLTWGRLGSRPGELNAPNGVAIGPNGNVFVADTRNNRIQEFSPTGQPLERRSSSQAEA